MKIVADKNIPLVEYLFSKIGDVFLTDGNRITPALVKDADLLIVRTVTRITADLLEGSRVKIVASATSGTDHVDRIYLQENGIKFFHSPGANARAVAEYVLSVICVFASQDGFNPRTRCVGIVGCGNVGSQLKHFLEILDIECIVNDPPLQFEAGDACYRDLSDVYAADIISMHVPLVDEGRWPTRHLVDESFLKRLKPDVILINTARGEVVDESILPAFIDAHPDARVALDVWKNEPDISQELLERVAIGTPHIAGYSLEGKIRATELIFRQVSDFLGAGSHDKRIYPGFNNYRAGISMNAIDDETEALQLALLSGYDVRSDSAALRRSIEISDSMRGAYFDDLRKTSMLRREFSAMTVELPAGHPQLQEKLGALGFNVAEKSG